MLRGILECACVRGNGGMCEDNTEGVMVALCLVLHRFYDEKIYEMRVRWGESWL